MSGAGSSFDFVIIGAGPAGEAAAFKSRELGASVAIIDRAWFGGSCPHVGCVPSKSLLNSAALHAANPASRTWEQAAARRDWMINRVTGAAGPDDGGHLSHLEDAGAVGYRGAARISGRGQVEVRHDGSVHDLAGRHIVVAVGSVSTIPPLPGLEGIRPWTNR